MAPIILAVLKKAQMYDAINERSSHTKITPRGGGLIFISASVLILLANLIHPFFIIPKLLGLIIVLSYACALIGFLDDKYSLPSWVRFLGQIIVVAIPSWQLPLIFAHVPAFLQYALYMVSWVWFINLFNFMDGTDGLAAQEAIFILVFILLISAELRPLCCVCIAAILGFLRYNYPKASIFMGDVGSYFLGYLLFGLMIYLATLSFQLILPFILMTLIFSCDATSTLIRRIVKKEPFLKPHRSHWFQRLYNMGYSHVSIFWLAVTINCFLLSMALTAFYYHWILEALIPSVLIILLIAGFIKYQEKIKK
jgi:UDP-N-acetylmuramyl pentapeptide phosphotransferase/UDP-N-acetylglucosamine-1-phosphate transferase